MDLEERVKKIIERLDSIYPTASCTLDFDNALQLLVSAQLAAQCTDKRVNEVTKKLYKRFKSVQDFADCSLDELEEYIRPVGFYHNKARNIQAACRTLLDRFNGEVPSNMKDLLSIPGVGRKTANLILGDFYGIPGVVVDTHAGRLSRLIGLTKNKDPEKVEMDLLKIVPKEDQTKLGHLLVAHGREVCKANKPLCEHCDIREYCDYGR